MLNEDVINSINESVLYWLATVDKNGEPNVSPKEMFIANSNDHILVANIASPNSIENINLNPLVCLSFINVFKQKGYKVKGTAKIIEQNSPEYLIKEPILRTLGGEQFKINSIIEIQVKSISPIVAPSYYLFPGTTESSQIQQAMNTYGVQPKSV